MRKALNSVYCAKFLLVFTIDCIFPAKFANLHYYIETSRAYICVCVCACALNYACIYYLLFVIQISVQISNIHLHKKQNAYLASKTNIIYRISLLHLQAVISYVMGQYVMLLISIFPYTK